MRQRTAKIIGLVSVLLALIGVAYGVLYYYGQLPWHDNSTAPSSVDQPNTTADPTATPPVLVMIDNLVDVRPQSGLEAADIIYEALVEGGITRLLAVYTLPETIERIGPIRSARLYFVDWAEEYDGVYAYVGGSPAALGATDSSQYLTDLNQFFNGEYYYRDEAIQAPHNVFSSAELFSQALQNLMLTADNAAGPLFASKAEPDPSSLPSSATPFTIAYSTDDYAVTWRYDAASNTYVRWNGGVEQPLRAHNVLVQKVETTVLEEATGRLGMVTLGSGEALLLQDGNVQVGTWTKTVRGERTRFKDAAGADWLMNAGSTWIEIVPMYVTITL